MAVMGGRDLDEFRLFRTRMILNVEYLYKRMSGRLNFDITQPQLDAMSKEELKTLLSRYQEYRKTVTHPTRLYVVKEIIDGINEALAKKDFSSTTAKPTSKPPTDPWGGWPAHQGGRRRRHTKRHTKRHTRRRRTTRKN